MVANRSVGTGLNCFRRHLIMDVQHCAPRRPTSDLLVRNRITDVVGEWAKHYDLPLRLVGY
jgi:hypothetical protein